jgi:hypothetical protein
MVLLESSIVKFIDLFKNITKEFESVKRLWRFFDEIPKMESYNS